ncbi:MAG: arginyltransferase [Tahibacter sp.]
MKSDSVRLFQTLPHACGYYPDRVAQNLVIDPSAAHLDRMYPFALSRGFRRAGGHVYHPRCPACSACIPCRVAVRDFRADRSQQRNLRRNADLSVHGVDASYTDEYFDLYTRYLGARHSGGGMDDPRPEDFERFLMTVWATTIFLELREQGRLVAVAVTDVGSDALSAVYTFFDPDLAGRGLGTCAILQQIDRARKSGMAYLYLGYWIAAHPKMDYKRRFRPLETLRSGIWQRME